MTYLALVLLSLTSCISRGRAQVAESNGPAEYSLDRLPPPTGGSQQLVVTTWNVRHLGRKSFLASDVLYEILNEGDVIAFQEVNSKGTGRQALKMLKDGMTLRTGRKMCYALTRLPSGEDHEVYGFIWRNDRVARVLTSGKIKYDCDDSADEIPLAAKVADQMVREPALANLIFKPNGRPFLLVSAHLVPEAKNPENEVAPLFAATEGVTVPTIVVGDFNLGNRPTESRGDPFAVARRLGFTASLDNVRTSLKRNTRDYSKPFDNLWIRGFELTAIARVDIFTKFMELTPEQIILNLSDHTPVSGGYTFKP